MYNKENTSTVHGHGKEAEAVPLRIMVRSRAQPMFSAPPLAPRSPVLLLYDTLVCSLVKVVCFPATTHVMSK